MTIAISPHFSLKWNSKEKASAPVNTGIHVNHFQETGGPLK